MLILISIWAAFVVGYVAGYVQWRHVDRNVLLRNHADFITLRSGIQKLKEEQKHKDPADWWKA